VFPRRIRAELRAGGCTEDEIALFLRIDGAARRRAGGRTARRALRGIRLALAKVVCALVTGGSHGRGGLSPRSR